MKKFPCCCCKNVVCALACALADCDRGVRRAAEKALKECGYEVDDCCNCNSCGQTCCNTCAPAACGAAGAAPAPAPAEGGDEAAPAPAPPAEPEAYFPSRIRNQQTQKSQRGLSNLFGLIR
ncbi:HEAT repeat domain-containing protein [Symmachiella dynata]|uniref:HEAT repeat domain-containing protein n=1 Tax=Symmachiella dynata TaxID=2527995 RepID=UPI001E55414E|nr:HEAT repeat domain-containing protein [Symmachiella dynata]